MKILRVNLAEADSAVLADRLRQVADKIEAGATGGNASEPPGSRNLVGSFSFIEFDDQGKEIPA